VPLILKLTALNLPPLHELLGDTPRQGLHIRFLVQTEHHFAVVRKPLHALIPPQNLGPSAVNWSSISAVFQYRLRCGGKLAAANIRATVVE